MKQEQYADLLIRSGLNVKKGQTVVIRASVEVYPFVRLLSKKALAAGAGDVKVRYEDEIIAHERYRQCDEKVFDRVWEHDALFYNETSEKGACYLTLVGEDPDLMKDVDPKRIASASKAMRLQTKPYRYRLDHMENQWCIAAVATKDWAKKVYPDLPEQQATDQLWQDIYDVSRVDGNDPIENWKQHKENFEHIVDVLNTMRIRSLHYKNSLGTDLHVDLPKGYLFAGGGSPLKDGTYYFPNIPTEEVFSAPHKTGVNGKLVSSMPLNHNGSLVKEFWFEFQDGKVVDYDAKEGKEVLTSILQTDEASRYLGEVALVPVDSPIAEKNRIFYKTLIDENASCHFALGQSYGECIQNGLEMDEQQLEQAGMNQSLTHVDFMVGTRDLSIEAHTEDDRIVPIFENGRFSSWFD